MDKALFVGMGSQKNSLRELEMLSNNLANVNTPGFRADYENVSMHHLSESDPMETRVYSKLGETYTDFKQGPILRTGRDLDLAISGNGMFSIQAKDGKEAYTRAGNFDISADGFLTTSNGDMVMGISGAIHIPKAERVEIGDDGTVSVRPLGEQETVNVGKLKLVNPDTKKLAKGGDGYFFMTDGSKLENDQKVKIANGALEGSNVNPVDTLIKLIDLSRHYEIHSNMIKNLSEQAQLSNKLLDIKS